MPDPRQPQTGPSRTPQSTPLQAPESAETQEIMRRYIARNKIYPDIKTAEDLEKKDFNGLVEPLEKNESELPAPESKFLKKVKELEGFMSSGNIADFSFDALKNIRDQRAVCENLESRISIVQQSASGNPPPPPDLEALYRAKNIGEFNANLNNSVIVNEKFAQDPEFKNRALLVFNKLQAYRDKHAGAIKNQAVRMYLNEIFKAANKDELEKLMRTSTIIKESSITPEIRAKINQMHEEYYNYRIRITKIIQQEVIINKQKETILTNAEQYSRSGAKFVSEKIQSVRENWAGMDGKERFIAGASILVGLSWFLNSKSESVGEIRDIMKKAALVGVGYIAVNTSTKLFAGKTAMELGESIIDDKSGKRDFLKDSFDTDKHGAEIMNSALVNLGPYDFVEIGEKYLRQEQKYKKYPVADNIRELPLGGLAEDQMHPRQIYIAMRLLSRKLEKEGSSMEQMINAIRSQEKEAKTKNRPFTRPTFALILGAVLEKDIQKHRYEGGKIIVAKTEKVDVPFDSDQRAAARRWWAVTGTPENWKKEHYEPETYPREEFRDENTKHISSNVLDIKKPLDSVIAEQYFGRYTAGFKSLYNLQIKNNPTEKIHMQPDTKENAVYISSKVPVDYNSFKSQTRDYARIAAVRSAYDEALKKVQSLYGNTPEFKDIKSRIHEFVQPVFGVFLAESEKRKVGPIKEYVMFLRLVLPGSVEFALRKGKERSEWPDGDMIQMMKEIPMKAGEKLTKAEFETLAQTIKRNDIKTKFPNLTLTSSFASVYGGAYECFLTNMRIKKTDNEKIQKVLDYYSKTYAGSGLSKLGLIRYLAAHNFTDEEIKKATGSNEAIPNEGLDIRGIVTKTTREADTVIEDSIKQLEASPGIVSSTTARARIGLTPGHISLSPFVHIDLPVTSTTKPTEIIANLKEYKTGWDRIIRNGFDKFFIALCNGDDKAFGVATSKLSTVPEFMALLGYISATTNPGGILPDAQKKQFMNLTMDSYKKFLLKTAEKPDILKKVMEAVEEYRKPA